MDEIQRVPELLNEVHRLFESRKLGFTPTGSSARKLRGWGVNPLAVCAVARYMYRFRALELVKDFDLLNFTPRCSKRDDSEPKCHQNQIRLDQ